MKYTLTHTQIARVVEENIFSLATRVPEDVLQAFQQAQQSEPRTSRGAFVLDQLLENAHIAQVDGVPLCQDTGSVWISLEVGPDTVVPGDIFSGVNDAVAQAYREHNLRKSIVKDALFNRENTQDNTPAFCDIKISEKPGARLHIMLKGGGSDNASRVVMLAPSAGKQGIIDEVLACVKQKAANACPPLVIGIGVGSTFDHVGLLAKEALLRPVGSIHPNEDVAQFEQELLEKVNATGLGPGALGGINLALAVHVNTAPCHIAALPLAINMGCSALRRTTIELKGIPCEGNCDGK
ncbi:MAG: fumarate hydratase [Eggerthellaceae bacterium]|nr:fumarate hydratase [Eggerthellaceae bacterium]